MIPIVLLKSQKCDVGPSTSSLAVSIQMSYHKTTQTNVFLGVVCMKGMALWALQVPRPLLCRDGDCTCSPLLPKSVQLATCRLPEHYQSSWSKSGVCGRFSASVKADCDETSHEQNGIRRPTWSSAVARDKASSGHQVATGCLSGCL